LELRRGRVEGAIPRPDPERAGQPKREAGGGPDEKSGRGASG
jgi:hypothetical protein